MTEFYRALRTFRYKGHTVLTGDVLRADQMTANLRSMIEAGFVKGINPMGEKYDPNALAKLAKDVDANVTEGDPANPRSKNDFPGDDAPEGVPNPNVTLNTPETPLANQEIREMEGEDMGAVAAETANTDEGLKAIDEHTVTASDVVEARNTDEPDDAGDKPKSKSKK